MPGALPVPGRDGRRDEGPDLRRGRGGGVLERAADGPVHHQAWTAGLGRQGPGEAVQAIPADLQPLPFPSEGRAGPVAPDLFLWAPLDRDVRAPALGGTACGSRLPPHHPLSSQLLRISGGTAVRKAGRHHPALPPGAPALRAVEQLLVAEARGRGDRHQRVRTRLSRRQGRRCHEDRDHRHRTPSGRIPCHRHRPLPRRAAAGARLVRAHPDHPLPGQKARIQGHRHARRGVQAPPTRPGRRGSCSRALRRPGSTSSIDAFRPRTGRASSISAPSRTRTRFTSFTSPTFWCSRPASRRSAS